MKSLGSFLITRKWRPRHADRIQLYSINSPNGVKVSIMLEETGLPYEPHLVRFNAREQQSAEFRSLNPYARIPAIIDPIGPEGMPLPLFESGAILIYLAEKCGQLLPRAPAARYETLQWVIFQSANMGPNFGQLGFFHKFEGSRFEDKRPRNRYAVESRYLLQILNARLVDRPWIMGQDYTIADIATFPLVRNLLGYYEAGDLVGMYDFPHVSRALETFVARPAVARGVNIPAS